MFKATATSIRYRPGTRSPTHRQKPAFSRPVPPSGTAELQHTGAKHHRWLPVHPYHPSVGLGEAPEHRHHPSRRQSAGTAPGKQPFRPRAIVPIHQHKGCEGKTRHSPLPRLTALHIGDDPYIAHSRKNALPCWTDSGTVSSSIHTLPVPSFLRQVGQSLAAILVPVNIS